MKKAGKRIIAIALALVLMLGLLPGIPGLVTEASAANVTDAFGFDTSSPEGFEESDDNPYGAGRIALNPLSELFLAGSGVAAATYDATDYETKKAVSQSALADTTEGYLYVEAVAFDPTGSGRKDHVAYIGLGKKEGTLAYDYDTYRKYNAFLDVWAVSAVTGQPYGEKVTLGTAETLSWLVGYIYGNFDLRARMRNELDWSSYLSITAGDRDGDGKDELYTYVPESTKTSPVIVQADVTSGKATTVAAVCVGNYENIWNHRFADDLGLDGIIPRVALAMGDPDKDNQDELTATVSWSSRTTSNWPFTNNICTTQGMPLNSCVLFFKDNDNTFTQYKPSVDNGNVLSLDYGDLTGDGRDDLIISDGYRYNISTYSDSGFTSITGNKTGYNYEPYALGSAIPVICFAGNGFNEPDCVFINGYVSVLKSSSSGYYLAQDKNFDSLGTEKAYDIGEGYRFYAAAAGNFDGNTGGYEQVVYSLHSRGTDDVAGTSATKVTSWMGVSCIYNKTLQQWDGVNSTIAALYNAVPGGNGKLIERSGKNMFMMPVAVDIDEDTCFVEYRSKEYVLESPKIIAILQAAPYFQDLEDYYYDATGSTTFGTSTGSGSGSSKAVTATSHAAVKLGGGVSFIVSFEAYVQVSMSTEWSREYSTTTTTEMAINFAGGQGENNVVIISTPKEVFTYDTYQPDGKGGFDKGKMTVIVPQPCQYKTLTVEQYNAAAEVSGFTKITDDQVHAVPGQPATYYQADSGELNGLTNLVKHKSEPVSVTGSETAKVGKSIDVSSEYAITTSMSFNTEIEAGVEVSGSGGSGGAGSGLSKGVTDVNTSAVTREVEVANVPGESNGLYSFLWNMAIWNTTVGNQVNVPVVGYILQDVKQPPSLPESFTVESTTKDSVTLSWDEGPSPASAYEIYQYFKNSTSAPYSKIAVLGSDAKEYKISGLSSGETFEYVICSLDAQGNRSIYSAPVTAVTLPENGVSPAIIKQPGVDDITDVIPGNTAVLSVTASPASGSAGGLTYAWYVSREGGSVWNSVGMDSNKLTLTDVSTKMDGNRYRCIISQVIGGKQVMVYSDIATLHVGQGMTSTVLHAEGNTGSADYSKPNTSTIQVERPKTISVQIGAETGSYTEYEATGTVAAGGDMPHIYQSSSGGYYVLEGLKETAGAYTADSAVLLSTDPRFFAEDAEGTTPYDGADPSALQGADRGVLTVPESQAAAGTNAGDYYVYNASITTGEADAKVTEGRTVYALKTEDPAKTYYTLTTVVEGTDENAKTTYTMTPVTPDEDSVSPVYVSGTLIVKDGTDAGTGEIAASIPDGVSTGYTTYAVYTTDPQSAEALRLYQTGGSYYLLTMDAGKKNVTARRQLYVIAPDTLSSEKPDNGDKAYAGVKAGNAVTVMQNVSNITYTPASGDSVTLTAKVDGGTETVNGSVTFKIVSNATGAARTSTAAVLNGTATLLWTPSAAGVYTITAFYNGSGLLKSSLSAPYTYYATDGKDAPVASYILRADDTVYGEQIELKLMKSVKDPETGVVSETPYSGSGATYKVISESDVELGNTSTYLAPKPGAYTFTATVQDGETPQTVSCVVHVSKRPMSVAVPDASVAAGAVPGFDSLVFQDPADKKGLLARDSEYKALFGVSTTLTESSGSGIYTVTPVMTANSAAFSEKYSVTMESGVWTVSANAHSVTVTAGPNGSATGYVGSAATLLEDSVSDGESLLVSAEPKGGFHVGSWTVMSGDTPLVAGQDYNTDKNVLTVSRVTKNLSISVTFAPNTYVLTFSAGEHGGVSAKRGDSAVTGTVPVAEGDSIVFTAVPDGGYAVESWTVGTVTQTNPDGTNYSSNTFTLDGIKESTAVKVNFTPVGEFDAAYALVNSDGGDAVGATVTALETRADGTTRPLSAAGGTVAKGSQLSFSVTPGSGTTVQEWKNGGQSVAESTLSYTIYNVQSAVDLKIVLMGGDTAVRNLSFSVISPAEGGGTLSADTNGTPLESGKGYSAFIPVDFSFSETSAYEVDRWTVAEDGGEEKTVLEGRACLSYSLPDGLQKNTVIKVYVKAKPTAGIAAGLTGGSVSVSYEPEAWDGYVYTGTTATVTAAPADGYVAKTIHSQPVNSEKSNGSISESFTVNANTIFTAEFLEKPTVMIGTATGGEVSVTGTADGAGKELNTGDYVDFGTNLTVLLEPGYGYTVGTIEGQDPVYTGATTDNMSYTIKNVQAVQTITPVWDVLPQFAVAYSVVDVNGAEPDGTNGSLSAAVERKSLPSYANENFGGGSVYQGSTITFTAEPNDGYRVQEWQVNGVVQKKDDLTDISRTFKLDILDSGAEVMVQFVQQGDKTTIKAGAHGAIASATVSGTPSGSSFTLAKGATVIITAQPETGYEVDKWTVNGTAAEGASGNTFAYTSQSNAYGAAIAVYFRPVEYSVAWSGENGSVTANGYDGVSAGIRGGEQVTFTAAANSGYELSGWTVNGLPVTEGAAGSGLTWTVPHGAAENPAVDRYEVKAVFSKGTYPVTVLPSEHGDINANVDLSKVTGGTQVTFTAVPDENYIVIGWTVGNQTTPSRSNTYAYTVNSAVSITAVIVPASYAISYSAGDDGSISAPGGAEGSVSVDYGSDVVFTATPDAFMQVAGWTLDGQPATVGVSEDKTTLTLSNVTKKHTVGVTFSEALRYSVSYAAGENGALTATSGGKPLTLNPGQAENIRGGTELVFTAVPNAGEQNYMVAQWTVNKTPVTAENMETLGVTMEHPLSNTLTISRLTRDTDVAVSFVKYVGYPIPESGAGHAVDVVSRVPALTYANASVNEIRLGGTVTFTVRPDGGYSTITKLTVNGRDCISGAGTAANCEAVTAVKNSDGSYTVTVAGVAGAFTTEIIAHKVFVDDLTEMPGALDDIYKEASDEEKLAALKSDLTKGLPAGSTGEVFKAIALRYQDSQGKWVDVSQNDFPINGAEVFISYPVLGKDADKTDSFTVTHMFTADGPGHAAGDVEIFQSSNPVDAAHLITRGEEGITFRVTAMSPFAIAYTNYTAPQGGGAAAPAESFEIKATAGAGGTITPSGTTAVASGKDLSYAITPRDGYEIAVVLVDGKLIGKEASFSFENVGENHIINAHFIKTAPCGENDSCASNKFTDVTADSWYHKSIDYAVENGLFEGTSDTTFSPETPMTRAMLVTVLYRAMGEPSMEDEILGYPFADVDAGAYYADAVYWARLRGIVSGYSDEIFAPDDLLTREQLATVLYRFAESPAVTGTLDGFADADAVSGFAHDALRWAVAEGIIGGNDNGLLDPKGEATRAQVATMFMRFLVR